VIARGDGIGLEISSTTIRGVRLGADDAGRAAGVCEIPTGRPDDAAAAVDALVRARVRLGDVAATTRATWFPAGSSLQRIDTTGLSPSELNAVRHDLITRFGTTATLLVDVDARRWMLAMHWDHARAWWWQERIEQAGFVDVVVEPAPLALGRVIGRRVTVGRRDAGPGDAWAAVYDRGVPVAAAVVEPGDRDHPAVSVSSAGLGLHDLDSGLDPARLAGEVATIAARVRGERDLELMLFGDRYPSFPAHDVRAPARVAIALGAALGAAGLAGRLRPVDAVSAVAAGSAPLGRPWVVERLPDRTVVAVTPAEPSRWTRATVWVRTAIGATGRDS
jgi:hypothetical protein